MKSTGIVRRIDELGRIVIPKEIRTNLKIKNNENLEIFIEEDSIIFKKFSKMEDSITYINKLLSLINKITNFDIIITDRDIVIATCGKNVLFFKNKEISPNLSSLIENRNSFSNTERTKLKITNNEFLEGNFYIEPLVVDSESLGSIILFSTYYDTSLSNVAKILSSLVANQIDINK